ncbi:MAG: glycoside hydrolase family 3 C-terminal domain-containing protein [Lachnospiraceae bacterium]|nr:glycoside hydrolase family 3 C-terminal domain-containing protein [Lachnospiraceae bacterium]
MERFNYMDSTLSPRMRAKDLLARMSLEEKFAQIQGEFLENVREGCTKTEKDKPEDQTEINGLEEAACRYPQGVGSVSCLAGSLWETRKELTNAIREAQTLIMKRSRHHIPALFHIETATGVLMPEATVFPSELARASSWDPQLEIEIGQVAGREARICGIAQGLAPVLDISRDARLGRQGESYGEDPTLAAAMGTSYVQGLQNNEHPDEGIMACGKHFLGFMNSMGGIHGAKSLAGDRELREVYGRVFQAAFKKADLRSVMNCYSVVNGLPVAGNRAILTDLLRKEMGFDGMVSADYASIGQLHSVHRLRENFALAGEMALQAGMDSELPTVECFNEELKERFRSGEADIAVLDQAVERILFEKFRLGLFENPFPASEEEIQQTVQTRQAKQVSLQSARECMVLLKNNGILPIIVANSQSEIASQAAPSPQGNSKCCGSPARSKKKVALIGWHGNTTRAFFGCYMNFARAEARLGAKITMAGTEGAEQAVWEQMDVSEPDGADGKMPEDKMYPGSAVLLEHPDTDALAKECYPGMKTLYEELQDRISNAKRAKDSSENQCRDRSENQTASVYDAAEIELTYSYGYPFTGDDTSHFAEALEAAKEADLVIVTLGGRYGWTTGCTTGEGIDSMNINLPRCQELFLEELSKLNKPTVGLHFDGRPCSSDLADQLDALVECWTPGVHGAEAVTDILLGRYNPSGKLPVSIAYNSGQIPVYYAHERGSGCAQAPSICFPDYLDGPHAPRYAFGHGLSYSEFSFHDFITDKEKYHVEEMILAAVTVENTGAMAGTDIVQLYVTDEYASVSRPVMELAGFARVELAPGEKKRVTFAISPSQFAFLDEKMQWKIEKGAFTLKIAQSSDKIDGERSIEILEDAWIEGRNREFYAQASISP